MADGRKSTVKRVNLSQDEILFYSEKVAERIPSHQLFPDLGRHIAALMQPKVGNL
jgi:hypothetical protein